MIEVDLEGDKQDFRAGASDDVGSSDVGVCDTSNESSQDDAENDGLTQCKADAFNEPARGKTPRRASLVIAETRSFMSSLHDDHARSEALLADLEALLKGRSAISSCQPTSKPPEPASKPKEPEPEPEPSAPRARRVPRKAVSMMNLVPLKAPAEDNYLTHPPTSSSKGLGRVPSNTGCCEGSEDSAPRVLQRTASIITLGGFGDSASTPSPPSSLPRSQSRGRRPAGRAMSLTQQAFTDRVARSAHSNTGSTDSSPPEKHHMPCPPQPAMEHSPAGSRHNSRRSQPMFYGMPVIEYHGGHVSDEDGISRSGESVDESHWHESASSLMKKSIGLGRLGSVLEKSPDSPGPGPPTPSRSKSLRRSSVTFAGDLVQPSGQQPPTPPNIPMVTRDPGCDGPRGYRRTDSSLPDLDGIVEDLEHERDSNGQSAAGQPSTHDNAIAQGAAPSKILMATERFTGFMSRLLGSRKRDNEPPAAAQQAPLTHPHIRPPPTCQSPWPSHKSSFYDSSFDPTAGTVVHGALSGMDLPGTPPVRRAPRVSKSSGCLVPSSPFGAGSKPGSRNPSFSGQAVAVVSKSGASFSTQRSCSVTELVDRQAGPSRSQASFTGSSPAGSGSQLPMLPGVRRAALVSQGGRPVG